MAITLGLVFFCLAKLAGWSWQRADFWLLISTPFSFIVLSFFALLFLEGEVLKIILGLITVALLWLFAENLFNFVHLPGAYQVNALEYLTWVLNLLSVFFLATGFFALRLYFGLPFWLLIIVFLLAMFGLSTSTLWVEKIESSKILPLGIGAAVLSSEFFVVLALLPIGFLSNAAFLSIFFYSFFGLTRAFLSGKLSSAVCRHYLLAAVLFSFLIIITTRWT